LSNPYRRPPPPILITTRKPVAQLCHRFKEAVVGAGVPRLGILPLLAALQRLRPSPEHLTPMHTDVLQL